MWHDTRSIEHEQGEEPDAQVDRNGKRGVIYTIAPSPLRAPLVWVGTDDGYIQVTTDDGATWQNVTPPVMTAWSRVTMMDASHFDARSAYASVDRHQLQDFDPYVYRTRDMGGSWQMITNGLPAGVYVHCIKEDPKRKGMLVCGTERGVYLSLNDGDHWQPLQLNLPVSSMRDFEIHDDDLVVGTHGRGIWVIDDISPLRQWSDDVLDAEAHLFKPADAFQYTQGDDNGTPLQKDEPQTQNRPTGVFIDYYLKRASSTPVTLEILDTSGKVVKTFSSNPASPPAQGQRRGGGGIASVSPLWVTTPERFSAAPGLHRALWNPVTQRETAPGIDGGARPEPEPLTGEFTARLTANGKSYTQSFVVKPDPRAR